MGENSTTPVNPGNTILPATRWAGERVDIWRNAWRRRARHPRLWYPPAPDVMQSVTSCHDYGLGRQYRTRGRTSPLTYEHATWPWRRRVTSLSLTFLYPLIHLYNEQIRRPQHVSGARLGMETRQSVGPTRLTGPKPTLDAYQESLPHTRITTSATSD